MLLVALHAVVSLAQTQGDSLEPKVVVVPYPGDIDAGAPVQVQPVAAPAPVVAPVDAPPPVPPAEPATRTIDAVPPNLQPSAAPAEPVAAPPPANSGAMLDGHPREGPFLSGPGSMTFVLHHSLMLGLGVLATQMVPRINTALQTQVPEVWTGQDARIAYLAGALIGGGLGFGTSAWWQFNHWISANTANFGIMNSLFGAGFLGGLTALITTDAAAISWMTVIGSAVGAWLSTIIGGGDLPLNHGLMIASGGGWAFIYTALILGIVASTGGAANIRAGVGALLLTPALGAGLMALATLKFNPSTAQILRADIFGVGAGAVLFLVSALAMGLNFASPVPYVVSGLGAIGAKVVVSLLWAEAAENPPMPAADGATKRYTGYW